MKKEKKEKIAINEKRVFPYYCLIKSSKLKYPKLDIYKNKFSISKDCEPKQSSQRSQI